MASPKILIVEDDQAIQQLLGRYLEHEGYVLTFCNDGFEAIEKLTHDCFNVVLLDLHMPNVDGFEVLKTMKRYGKLCQTKVMVVSSLEGEDPVVDAFTLGALDFINKPFNKRELQLRVRRLLSVKTNEESMRAGFTMMQHGVNAVRTLIQSPLSRASIEADKDQRFASVQNDLRDVNELLQQFELYLSMQTMALKRVPTRITELLEAAVLTCPGKLHLPHEGPHVNIPESTQIKCDGRLVKNALVTLLGNAAKHGPEDEPVKVEVCLNANGTHVDVAVANRCAGIPADQADRLFTPFAAADDGRGFGLDLALAALTVKKHGGDLACESQPGGWTTFTLSLPIYKNTDAMSDAA